MSYRDPKPYLPKCSYEDAIKFPYSGGISGTLLDVVPDVETGGNNSFVALVSRDQGGCVKIATNQGTRIYTGSGLIWPQDTADTKSDMATSRTKFDEAIEKLRGKRVVLTMIADSETGQSWLDGIGLYNSEAETLAVTLGALEHSSAAVSNASIAK